MHNEDIDDQIIDVELFDISDIEITFQRTRGSCKVYMILESQTPIGLMRFYLALKEYITKIENELNVSEEQMGQQ